MNFMSNSRISNKFFCPMDDHQKSKKRREVKNLPEEIWKYHVFSFLEKMELFKVFRVCTSFAKYVKEMKLEFHFGFGKEESTFHLEKGYFNIQCLEKYDLSSLTFHWGKVKKSYDLSKFSTLEVLKIDQGYIDRMDVNLSSLRQISALTNLKVLYLSGFSLNYDFLESLKNLHTLSLVQIPSTYNCTIFKGKSLENIKNLTFLEKSYQDVALKAFPKLETLKILFPTSIKAKKQLLTMKSLTSLDITDPMNMGEFDTQGMDQLKVLKCYSFKYTDSIKNLQEIECRYDINIFKMFKYIKVIVFKRDDFEIKNVDLPEVDFKVEGENHYGSISLKNSNFKSVIIERFTLRNLEKCNINYLYIGHFHFLGKDAKISGNFDTIRMFVEDTKTLKKYYFFNNLPHSKEFIFECIESMVSKIDSIMKNKNVKYSFKIHSKDKSYQNEVLSF